MCTPLLHAAYPYCILLHTATHSSLITTSLLCGLPTECMIDLKMDGLADSICICQSKSIRPRLYNKDSHHAWIMNVRLKDSCCELHNGKHELPCIDDLEDQLMTCFWSLVGWPCTAASGLSKPLSTRKGAY